MVPGAELIPAALLAALACVGCTTLVPLPAGSADGADGPASFETRPGAADAGPVDGADAAGEPAAPSDLDLTHPLLPGQARAGVVDQGAELLGGPRAEGRLGDLRIYNHDLAVIIEDVRPASGYRRYGGWPVDVALLGSSGTATKDRYGELFLVDDLDVFVPELLLLLDDGVLSGEAHVRVIGALAASDLADAALAPALGEAPGPGPGLKVLIDYRLGGDDRALTIDITYDNPGDAPVTLHRPGLLAHFGDGVYPWAPGLGFEATEETGPVAYVAAAGRDLSYAIIAADDDLEARVHVGGATYLEQGPIEVPAGGQATRRLWLGVTVDGPAGLGRLRRDLLAERVPLGTLSGPVALPSTAVPKDARVAIRAFDGGMESMLPVRSDASFAVELPVGSYEIVAWALGHQPSAPSAIFVLPGDDLVVSLEIPQAARVPVAVRDADTGEPLPARVTFLRQGETPSAWPPPDVYPASEVWDPDVAAVARVVGAAVEVTVPPGTYQVVASRSYSYEIAVRDVTLAPGLNPALELAIAEVVDTTGWLSADLHLHGERSPGSSIPYDVRALQAVTEDLDVPVLTEHLYVAGLGPALSQTGLAEAVIDVVGQEVTSFTWGHFAAFPLKWSPNAVSAGAVWAHDKTPAELIAAVRAQPGGPETIVQVAHPRHAAPAGYFEVVGLDAAADTVADPDAWTDAFDSVEVFHRDCDTAGANGAALADWIGLTSHGHRKALAGGSGVSGPEPPGMVRSWLRLDAEAAASDPAVLVDAVRERQLVVSCGPFVRFTAVSPDGGGVGLGGLVGVDEDGQATFHVTVAAPTWIEVGEVRLLEDGEVVDVVDASGSADAVVRLDTDLVATPVADAWYAIEVVGGGSLWPVGLGAPYALTNPIEVDADGDGAWTPPAAASR